VGAGTWTRATPAQPNLDPQPCLLSPHPDPFPDGFPIALRCEAPGLKGAGPAVEVPWEAPGCPPNAAGRYPPTPFPEGCGTEGWTGGCSAKLPPSRRAVREAAGKINSFFGFLKANSRGIFGFYGNFRQSWETFPAAASASLPDRPRHSAKSLNCGYLQGKSSFSPSPPARPPANPLTCCLQSREGSPKQSREGSPKPPVPSAAPALGCCATERSGEDCVGAKDGSALTRSGDDRGWGRRESHAQAGKEGRKAGGGISSPWPFLPPMRWQSWGWQGLGLPG